MPGYPGPKKKYCLCCGISVAASDQPGLNAGWVSEALTCDFVEWECGLVDDIPTSKREDPTHILLVSGKRHVGAQAADHCRPHILRARNVLLPCQRPPGANPLPEFLAVGTSLVLVWY